MADPERFDAQTDPTFQADADPDQEIPRGVNLPGGICDPGESLMTSWSQQLFLKHLHRPLKGQWHKNKCGFLFC